MAYKPGLNYILDANGNPQPEPDVFKWACAFKAQDRRVAFTEIGDIQVSTAFLASDHNWTRKQAPILFETMIFDRSGRDRFEDVCDRYETRAQAIAGHKRWVEKVRMEIHE